MESACASYVFTLFFGVCPHSHWLKKTYQAYVGEILPYSTQLWMLSRHSFDPRLEWVNHPDLIEDLALPAKHLKNTYVKHKNKIQCQSSTSVVNPQHCWICSLLRYMVNVELPPGSSRGCRPSPTAMKEVSGVHIDTTANRYTII